VPRFSIPSWLLSRPAFGVVAVALLALFLGCMGGPDRVIPQPRSGAEEVGVFTDPDSGVVKQTGHLSLSKSEQQKVYYPIPYATVPNLTLLGVADDFSGKPVIVQQETGWFLIHNTNPFNAKSCRWEARGLKTAEPAGPPLPPRPVPIEATAP
jgi:hypothetical protein